MKKLVILIVIIALGAVALRGRRLVREVGRMRFLGSLVEVQARGLEQAAHFVVGRVRRRRSTQVALCRSREDGGRDLRRKHRLPPRSSSPSKARTRSRQVPTEQQSRRPPEERLDVLRLDSQDTATKLEGRV